MPESIDILKPPTDNLYKFLALFGLIIFIAGLIGPVVPLYLSERALLEQQNQQGVDAVDYGEMKQKREDALNRAKNDEEKKIINSRLNLDLNKRIAQSNKFSRLTDYYISLTNRAVGLAVIFLCVGCVITAFGFTLWMSRVQRFEDLKLARESLGNEAKIKRYKEKKFPWDLREYL